MIISIIGLGLIGGSMAIDLKRCAFASQIIGVDNNPSHCDQALELGIVDEIKTLDEAIWIADIIILSIPVDSMVKLLPNILDKIDKHSVITDVGSTKFNLIESVKDHPKRKRYVASHPMAGTEYSGPKAAVKNLFQEKVSIICNKEESDEDAVRHIEKMYRALYMKIIYMDAKEHDVHAAYVSHISHISSFVLANTVLEKEKSASNIFNLASGGFASTVRLAKSSPQMWSPIFVQNSENILQVLETYIQKLTEFKNLIEQKDLNSLENKMSEANEIRKIIK